MATTYEPIATTTLTSAQSSVTFSSISSGFTDLILVAMARADRTTNTSTPVYIRINSDTGSNYSQTFLYGSGTTAGSSRASNGTAIYTADISANSSGGTAFTGFGTLTINFNNYSNSSTYKTTLARVSSPNSFVEAVVGLWRSTSAINSIVLFSDSTYNFVSGSTFTLYGIKAA